jgi:ABC-type Zn uptake system ZnuABC Zn-binding protein ZnuA
MGDVHPLGNPHFSLDPGFAPIITQNIADGLSAVSPEDRPVFERNRQAFLERLRQAMARWSKLLEPVRGSKVVVYHPDFIYLLTRFSLIQVGMIEDRPGIPPSPQHLAQLIRTMKNEKIKMILVEPWNDFKLAQRVGEEAGAKAYVMASSVGAVKGADNYIDAIEYNVSTLVQGLK